MVNKELTFDNSKDYLVKKLTTIIDKEGIYNTQIKGVRVYRKDKVKECDNCIYQPLVAFIVQGFKTSLVGNQEFDYGEGNLLISGIDIPSISNIKNISPERPFLSIGVLLDKKIIADLITEIPSIGQENFTEKGISVIKVDNEILDVFIRLIDILNKPEENIMGPLILKELHYKLLISPYGNILRQINNTGARTGQITKVVSWLRNNFKNNITIRELAENFNLTETTLHRQFKKLTTMTPLQYQKRMCLQEAQRLMLVENLDANRASLAVGYESPQQFNREYKRLFGQPPLRYINTLK